MLIVFLKWAAKGSVTVVVTLLVMLVMGELLIRARLVLPAMKYDKSDNTVPFVQPNQSAVMHISNYTYRCPVIRINGDGMRGSEVDWTKKVMLVLGSSQAMGTGVYEDEVCAAVLQRELEKDHPNEFSVANGALGGFGPYHQSVMLDRVLADHRLSAVIVRLGIEECNFRRKETQDRGGVIKSLRDHLQFFSTISRKAVAQYRAARKVRFRFSPPRRRPVEEAYSTELGRYLFRQNQAYWSRMMELTAQRDVPLIFITMNPLGTDSERALQAGLRQLSSGKSNVSLVEMGPKPFQLQGLPTQYRQGQFSKQWTLQRDPHANVAQHALLGTTAVKILEALKIVSSLPQE